MGAQYNLHMDPIWNQTQQLGTSCLTQRSVRVCKYVAVIITQLSSTNLKKEKNKKFF